MNIDSGKIQELRETFRELIGKQRNKVFEKKENGICFVLNRLSFNKIGCIKSIMKSVNNGFTPEEHFIMARNIKDLFEHSEVIAQHYETKKIRTETHYLCRCQIAENMYAFMPVITWNKNEGYIAFYLSKDGE